MARRVTMIAPGFNRRLEDSPRSATGARSRGTVQLRVLENGQFFPRPVQEARMTAPPGALRTTML